MTICLANPYGPRLWAKDTSPETRREIAAILPGYSIESIHWDIAGYLYRLSVNQLNLFDE